MTRQRLNGLVIPAVLVLLISVLPDFLPRQEEQTVKVLLEQRSRILERTGIGIYTTELAEEMLQKIETGHLYEKDLQKLREAGSAMIPVSVQPSFFSHISDHFLKQVPAESRFYVKKVKKENNYYRYDTYSLTAEKNRKTLYFYASAKEEDGRIKLAELQQKSK